MRLKFPTLSFLALLFVGVLINSCGTGFCGFTGCGDSGSEGGNGGSGGSTGSPTFVTGSGFNGSVSAIAVASDGTNDVYVAGSFTSFNGTAVNNLARLNDDGSLDTNFQARSVNGPYFALSIDPAQNTIYLGGAFTTYQGISVSNLVRVRSNGETDAGFVVAGFNSSVNAVVVHTAADLVYAAGGFTSYGADGTARIAAMQTNGAYVVSFTGQANDAVRALTLPGILGALYVAGEFTSYAGTPILRVVRIHTTGSFDSGFTEANEGFDAVANALALASGGDVYVGGAFSQFTQSGVNASLNAARLNSDGSYDAVYSQAPQGPDAPVNTVLVLDDGDVYLGGSFLNYKGLAASRIVRTNADATRDSAFSIGSGFDGQVFALAARPGSTDIYVGGLFSSYNSVEAGRIIRLNSDGTND